MKLLNTNAKTISILWRFIGCMAIVFLYSCGSGGSGEDSSKTGSVSFSLAMQDQRSNQVSNIRAAADAASPFECQTDTYTIASIEAQIVDENNELLAEGGPWDCEDHQGNINEVKPGDGRIAIVYALDESGNAIADGQSDPLTVSAGRTVNAGTIILSLLNSAPVANAGPDQTRFEGDTVTLDGSGSSDADGDALTYFWSFTSLPTESEAYLSDPTAVKPTFVVDVLGTYEVQLVVNDGALDSDPDTVLIDTQNSAPVANAGPDQTPVVNVTVALDGSASSDVNGDALTYSWSFTIRPVGSAAALSNPTAVNPTFYVDRPGTYEVQLVVNDGALDSDPDIVIFNTMNSAPVANAGPDQSVFVNDTVTLDGNDSSDVDGDALTYFWSFTSRPGGSEAVLSNTNAVNPTFDVDVFGTYVVQLIVNDGTVDSNSPDTVTIVTQNRPPVLGSIGPKTLYEGESLAFMVVATDPDGNCAEITAGLNGEIGKLPTGANFNDNGDCTASFAWNPSFDDAGTYSVQFTATDSATDPGPLSDFEDVIITVVNLCPDLVVTNINSPTWDAESGYSVIQAEIRNFGNQAAGPSIARIVDPTTLQESGAPYDDLAPIEILEPGASITVTFYLPYWVYNPDVTLEVTADYTNEVSECNEDNNILLFEDQG